MLKGIEKTHCTTFLKRFILMSSRQQSSSEWRCHRNPRSRRIGGLWQRVGVLERAGGNRTGAVHELDLANKLQKVHEVLVVLVVHNEASAGRKGSEE